MKLLIPICLLAITATAQNGFQFVQTAAVNAPVAAGGGGGIELESVSAVLVESSALSDPENFTHTIATLSDGYIVVHISYYLGSASPTDVTFDSVSMTKIGTATCSFESSLRGDLWGLAVGNKTAGTYTVSIIGAGGDKAVAASTSWNNVHQTTSVGTPATAEGDNTTAPSVAVGSATGEIVVDVLARYSGGTATIGGGQTSLFNDSTADGTIDGAASYEAGAGSVTMSWTLASPARWVVVGIPLKPAT